MSKDILSNTILEHPTEFALYDQIVADPPWSKNQKGSRGAQKHYDLMSLEEIMNLPVGDLTAENAVCWLWVTNSTIDDGYDVLRKWGFEPKSILTWFKFRPQLGLGVYLHNDTEHVPLGVKRKMPMWACFPSLGLPAIKLTFLIIGAASMGFFGMSSCCAK